MKVGALCLKKRRCAFWHTSIFYSLFHWHIPRNASRAWHGWLIFVKRAVGNSHKRTARWTCHTLAFPARMECSLKDEREQALFPCFHICKSSSLCSPPAGIVVLIISIGKGSYVFFTTLQGRAVPVWWKNLPCLARYFLPKILQTLNTTLLRLCETKTTDPTGRRIKKSRIYGKQEKSSVKLQSPSPLKSA